ncbi:hypothetical protein X756_31885 [Mesorhizobium sp. LSHC412B00]|nr:hypothetical protein X756_31885 [Mesorhizobium sp. LSHC412B00]
MAVTVLMLMPARFAPRPPDTVQDPGQGEVVGTDHREGDDEREAHDERKQTTPIMTNQAS